MDKKFPYADPMEIEKKRALEFLALSPTERFNALIQLIKINYEIRRSNKELSPVHK